VTAHRTGGASHRVAHGRWTYEVQLLGEARVHGPKGTRELERKAAACLAMLAIEGRQVRLRLADRLWPSANVEAGRANLRQVARRLRLLTGADVLTSGDPVALSPLVKIDVRQLTTWAAAGDWSRVAECRGGLLAGFTYDDCPDLDDWVELARQRLVWTVTHALHVEAMRIERESGALAAMPVVLRWLELDPLSEEAHRQLMRVHVSNGDRGAALHVFETYRKRLKQQLDLAPSEETDALAREIRGRGATSVPPAVRVRRPRALPLSVLRPPLLAGRRQAWQRLSEGFEAGALLMVSGPAGIGKTRLVQDFAAAQQGYRRRYVACRPGDRALPYVYYARTWRHDLAVFPERLGTTPRWVRSELARILPELGDPPPPITKPEQRQRFFDANVEMARANDDRVIMISDDVHHLDAASHELGIYLGMDFMSRGSAFRSISTFRPDELEPDASRLLETLFDTGTAVRVELTPLSAADLHELLEGLELPRLERHAERLHLHTGGIPFYVVETLKAWFEEAAPDEAAFVDLPESIAPPERVRITIERRLSRLGALALTLLRATAILDAPLSFELGLMLAGGDGDGLTRAWTELEAALLLRGGVIAHELLWSVILASMPEPDRVALHARVAAAFDETGAHPATIGEHWAAAGRHERAAACFEEAERIARAMFRAAEAETFRRRAAELRART
jgi:DNA-binding SARP family transcriptional activator